jgi:ABC-type protease/lipase transport system fused ATPase/permease subunit
MLVMADGAVHAFGNRDEVLQRIGRPRVVAGNDLAVARA